MTAVMTVMTKRWWKHCDPSKFLLNIFMTYMSLGFKEIKRLKIVTIL